MFKPTIGRFIDPLTDFGFKRLFGSEPNKDLLIDFLNHVLAGSKVVADIHYNKNELHGTVQESRKSVYDLRCTGADGEQFIIEVQKVGQKFFRDRCVYYTSALIHDLGPKGTPEWDYELPEVYLVGLMEFVLGDNHAENFLHQVRLTEVGTGAVFYNKLAYFFLEIPKFNKQEEELETGLDKWMFILRNLSQLDKIPVILDKRIFSKLFKLAEVAKLTKEEHKMYEKSLMQKWDYKNGIDYAVETAVKEAVKEAEEKAAERERILLNRVEQQTKLVIEQTAEREKLTVATYLLKQGLAADFIQGATGLSIGKIAELASQIDENKN